VNIVRTVATKSSNRLKFCWLKVICCICQSNELEHEIKQKKLGGKQGASQKWPTQAVAARGEIGREGCEISSLVEHMGLSPCLSL